MFTSATAHCSLCQMTLLAPWTPTRLFSASLCERPRADQQQVPAATSEPYAWHTEGGAAAQLGPEGEPHCPWQWWLPVIAKLGQLYRHELRVLNSALFIAPTVPLPEQEGLPLPTATHPDHLFGFPLVLAAPAAADAPVPSAPAPAPALAPALHRCSTQFFFCLLTPRSLLV